jgi:hypothetical protein
MQTVIRRIIKKSLTCTKHGFTNSAILLMCAISIGFFWEGVGVDSLTTFFIWVIKAPLPIGTSSYLYISAAAETILELIVERLRPLSNDALMKLAREISDLGSKPLKVVYSKYCLE